MLKVSKEKNIIKLENTKNLSYKKKDKTIKSLPNKEIVYVEGKPGKDGETPAIETLVDIIKPLIPEVKDGKTPTKKEVKAIVEPLIPTAEEVAEIVLPKIPKPEKLKFSDLTIDERASLEGPRGVPGMTVRLSDIYEGTWNATGDYLVDEIVVYNDNTYFAKRRNKGVTPGTDPFIWQFLAPYSAPTPTTPTLQEVTDEGNTTTNDIIVPDEVYGAGWNGDLSVPTKNALYDKIETITSTPGGSDTQVQFNDGGVFGGDAGFTYNKTTNTATIGNIIDSGLTANGMMFADSSKQLQSNGKFGYSVANNQLYWTDAGTNASFGSVYIYDLTHSFKDVFTIYKPTWGSAFDIHLSTLSPVIKADGGSTFVAYTITDTGTYLFNSYVQGATLTIRSDTDNYGTMGFYAKGYNNNSAPSSSGAAKRAISYGVVGEAQSNATGFGGAGLRSISASANIDGVRADVLSGQTAPLFRGRMVDNFNDAFLTVNTDLFRVEASGSIWNRLTTKQQQWEYDASNYANITVGSTGATIFDAVGSGSSFAFLDSVTARRLALGTTPTDGFIAENTTAATSGNQQISPSVRWSGKGWSTGGAGSSQSIDFRKYLLPVQGASGATGTLLTQISRNGAAYSTIHSQSTTGGIVQTILSGVSETVGYEMAASFSNTDTTTTQHIKLSNSGGNTWITAYFAGVQKGAMGWDNSGIMRFYASGNTYKFHSGVTGTTLIAEIYAGGFYNNGGNFNAGRVTAGSATVSPPTTFSNYGSTSLKTTIITTNTTLTDDYTQVIVDCSSNDVCTGTPSVTDCSTYTGSGQATCESHLPCAWNAGSSCSAFDNEFGMGTCSGTSGCSPATSSCSPYNSDQATCEAVPGNNYGGTCTWDAGSNTCPSQDCTTCASAGCSPNLGGDCSVFSDGGGDGTACYAAPCGACSYDSGSGVCSGSYFISCDGDNTTPSCNGTYYTGGCSGTYGAACTGTATCSGYGSETPCEAEAGCNWTSGVEITLPASPVEQTYWIAKDYTAGALTILPNSGQTVNNTTSITSSSTAGVGWMLTWVESKANWYIMNVR